MNEDLRVRASKDCFTDVIEGSHVIHFDMPTDSNLTLLVLRKQVFDLNNLREHGSFEETVRIYDWTNLDQIGDKC